MSTVDANMGVQSCQQGGSGPQVQGRVRAEARRVAERFALIGMVAAGIGRCACIGAALLVWMGIGDDIASWMRYGQMAQEESWLIYAAVAAMCAAAGQVVLGHYRRRVLVGVVSVAGLLVWALLWCAAQSYQYGAYGNMYRGSNLPMSGLAILVVFSLWILAGAVVGSVAHSLIWRYWARCSAWGVPALASVGLRGARFCRGCGASLDGVMPVSCQGEEGGEDVLVCSACEVATPAGGWSGEISGVSEKLESALARHCEAIRSMGVMAAGMMAFFGAYFLSDATPLEILEMAVWLIVTGLAGGLLAITTLPWKLRFRAVVASVLVILGGCVCGWVAKLAMTSGGMRFEREVTLIGLGEVGALAGWGMVSLIAPAMIRVLTPKYLHRHLLAEPSAPAAPAATAALCELRCEQCGYQLNGLSAGTCAQCGNMHLRCPECGHAQPADTQNVEWIKPLHLWHGSMRRLIVAFHILILVGFTLPWLAVYMRGNHIGDWHDIPSLALMSLFLIGPMRLVTMRIRPAWASLAVCCGLPLGAGIGCVIWGGDGPWMERLGSFVRISMWTLPAWIVAALLVGWLCRAWFWLMYGREAGAKAYRWFSGRVYRRREAKDRLNGGEIFAGENIGRYCQVCGERVTPAAPERCEACGTSHITCGHCVGKIPVSATGATLDSVAGRLQMMMLGVWGGVMAGAMLLAMTILGALVESDAQMFLYGYGWNYQVSPMRYESMAMVAAWSAVVGVTGGIILLRRRHVGWAAAWSLLALTATMLVLSMSFSREYSIARLIIVLGIAYVAMLAGHVLAYPAVWLAARIVLPVKVAKRMMPWIGGTSTLDEAAGNHADLHGAACVTQ